MRPSAARRPRPSGIPTSVTRAMTARTGRPKKPSSPQPIAGPIWVRPASRILPAPRPTSHTSTSPTTSVETETASHQASRPAQPNPSHRTLVCTRRRSPPIVAPDATTGACWETTSPVTLAPERSSSRPLNTTTSPLTRPEMVTGASKAVRDPSTVPSTVEEPWKTTRSPTVWPLGTSARPDRTTNASVVWASCAHAGAASPSKRRAKSPITIDRRTPITSKAFSPSSRTGGQLNTSRHALRGRGLDGDHDVASFLACLDIFVGLDDLVQPIPSVDDRLERSELQQPLEIPRHLLVIPGNGEHDLLAAKQRRDEGQDRILG